MVVEIAEFFVLAGHEDAFADAYRRVRPVLTGAAGCRAATMIRGIESPGRFVLVVEWERLDDHTTGFRESDAFLRWRAAISEHFAAPPSVAHGMVVEPVRPAEPAG